jgi:hypothetical protein
MREITEGREELTEELTSILTGGPFAFPGRIILPDGKSFVCPGMTLRDYFAGQALDAITVLDRVPGEPKLDDYYVSVADYAYSVADAMIEVRSHHQSPNNLTNVAEETEPS